jgi:hypothetical protein
MTAPSRLPMSQSKGSVNVDGYVEMSRHGVRFYEHRMVWEKEYGTIPAGHDIHHIDGDKQNNDITNLRCILRSEHARFHTTRRYASGAS